MRTISSAISRMIPGRPGPRRSAKFHLCATRRRCHRINVSAETIVSNSSSALGPDRLGLSRQQRRFRVGKPDALSAQPLFQELILSLQELDNDQLVAIDPAGRDHQQKREQRRN